MSFSLLQLSARYLVFAIEDGGLYHTLYSYEYTAVPVGNAYVPEPETVRGKTDHVVTGIYGLLPDMEYQITFIWEENGKAQSSVSCVYTRQESVTLDVRAFGAAGDGIQDDTSAIQAAILSCPAEGRVLLKAGRYQVTSLFLKSHTRIEFAKGAELLGTRETSKLPVLPGLLESYTEESTWELGSFEGNPLSMYASLLTGIDVEDCEIYGEGILNGNAGFDNWWRRDHLHDAVKRPNLVFLNHCRKILFAGLRFTMSPMWTIHPYFSEQVDILDAEVQNPWDSPNTDGLDPESCTQMRVMGVHFSLGDDCIAIKSGKIYLGRKYKKPSSEITISHCLMERGHGAVTIGSEIAGGVHDICVENCLFRDTDRGLRIKTRRGRGKDSYLNDISFRNIKMEHVLTPFTANAFYFCDPDGKTDYVQTRVKLPVDERTPGIGTLSFENIVCTDAEYAAAYFLGLPEQPIERIRMKNIRVRYQADAGAGFPVMALEIPETRRLGIYAENVAKMELENIDLEGQLGEKVIRK